MPVCEMNDGDCADILALSMDGRGGRLAADESCNRHCQNSVLVRHRRLDRLDRLRQLFLRRQWNDRAIEGEDHDLVHRLDEVELHLLADVRRDLLEVALVLGGEDDRA